MTALVGKYGFVSVVDTSIEINVTPRMHESSKMKSHKATQRFAGLDATCVVMRLCILLSFAAFHYVVFRSQ